MPGADRQHHQWAPVDSRIWAPARRKKRIRRILEKLVGAAASIAAPALVVVGPLMILVTILAAYYIVGPALIGPALLGVLALFFAGFVIITEKMGYARNFEGWDFPLSITRVAAMVTVFAAIIAFAYVTLYIWKP
jgi:hypothetical protein